MIPEDGGPQVKNQPPAQAPPPAQAQLPPPPPPSPSPSLSPQSCRRQTTWNLALKFLMGHILLFSDVMQF